MSYRSTWPQRLAGVLAQYHGLTFLGLGLLLVALAAVSASSIAFSGELVVRSLMPPIYPGSERLNVERNEVAGYVFEVTTYRTDDKVPDVVQYMRAQYGDFVMSTTAQVAYRQGFSALNLLDYAGLGPTLEPMTNVSIEATPHGGPTIIQVVAIWPTLAAWWGAFTGDQAAPNFGG
jgi:hypothetical protein